MYIFGYLIVILQQYIVPFIFAIGLIFFIYGIIRYFILGPGEEPTRDAGRIDFLKAFVWFTIGITLYGLVTLMVMFFTWVAAIDVETTSEQQLLSVPDVPEGND